MSPAGARSSGTARHYKVASAFLAILTFTVIVGYYVPLQREAKRLRREYTAIETSRAQLAQDLEHTRRELDVAQNQNQRLWDERGAHERSTGDIEQRIQRLKDLLNAQFGRLAQAKMLVVSSAGDRVSVAIAMDVLFPDRRPEVTKNGRGLLCQLSKTILAEYAGQIRVTGYYGKASIQDPGLARRYGTAWELSAARAASAADVLVRECGGPSDRFLVVGYGPRPGGPLGANVALEFVYRGE
jgi:flagellar motor protein MotB